MKGGAIVVPWPRPDTGVRRGHELPPAFGRGQQAHSKSCTRSEFVETDRRLMGIAPPVLQSAWTRDTHASAPSRSAGEPAPAAPPSDLPHTQVAWDHSPSQKRGAVHGGSEPEDGYLHQGRRSCGRTESGELGQRHPTGCISRRPAGAGTSARRGNICEAAVPTTD